MPRYLVPPKKPTTTVPDATAPGPPKSRLGLADIAWVARMALDRRKLLVAFAGLLAAGLGFFAFASLGNVLGSAVWQSILRYLGASLAYLVLAFTCFALARMVQFEVRTGGVRRGIFETLRYCLRRLRALVLTPVIPVIAALVAVGLMGLVAWLGRIVPTIFTFFFLVEFALGTAVVAAGLILTWGLFLYPAILAVEDSDELDAVRRYLTLYHQRGLALAGYEVLALWFTWLAALVPGVVAVLGLGCVVGTSRYTMGKGLAYSFCRVPAVFLEIVEGWLAGLSGGVWGLSAVLGSLAAEPAGTRADGPMYGFSGAFLGVSLLIIIAASLAYALAFFVAAGTRVYLAFAPPPTDTAAEQRVAA